MEFGSGTSKKIMKTTNIVQVTGKISNIRNIKEGKRRAYFTVESYTKGRGARLSMSYQENLPENIKEGDTVEVKGYVSTVKKFNEESGRTNNLTYINITSIEKKKSEMEKTFKKPGSFHSGDEIKAMFAGSIINIVETQPEDWLKIIILVDEDRIDRYSSNIVLDCYMKPDKNGSKMPTEFKKGDIVYCVCSIVSATKKIKGKYVHFQNFKVEDIVIEGNRFDASQQEVEVGNE